MHNTSHKESDSVISCTNTDSLESSVEAEKDKVDNAVSLSHRLGFRGELNNGTLCILVCSV